MSEKYELRKDMVISCWVAVSERPLAIESYAPWRATMPGGECPLCAGGNLKEILCSVAQADSSRCAVRVVEDPEACLNADGQLKRRGMGMHDVMNAVGRNEIIVEHPEHGPWPEELGREHFERVLQIYARRLSENQKHSKLRYTLIGKNYGVEAGGRYSHPHSEVLSTPVTPRFIKEELDGAKLYYSYKERCVFCDILSEEKRAGIRIVAETERMTAFCPFASRYPFEVWVMPKRHECAFQNSSEEELRELSGLLGLVLGKLNRALGGPAYSYWLHTAPNSLARRDHWHTLGDDYHWHIEIMPRLGGFSARELGAGFFVLRTSPEDAAKFLKEA